MRHVCMYIQRQLWQRTRKQLEQDLRTHSSTASDADVGSTVMTKFHDQLLVLRTE